MITESEIRELVTQYGNHGWKPMRILLSKAPFARFEKRLIVEYETTAVLPSSIDAVWFARPNGEMVTWEIRCLSGAPYALLRFLPHDAEIDELNKVLAAAEIEVSHVMSRVQNQN